MMHSSQTKQLELIKNMCKIMTNSKRKIVIALSNDSLKRPKGRHEWNTFINKFVCLYFPRTITQLYDRIIVHLKTIRKKSFSIGEFLYFFQTRVYISKAPFECVQVCFKSRTSVLIRTNHIGLWIEEAFFNEWTTSFWGHRSFGKKCKNASPNEILRTRSSGVFWFYVRFCSIITFYNFRYRYDICTLYSRCRYDACTINIRIKSSDTFIVIVSRTIDWYVYVTMRYDDNTIRFLTWWFSLTILYCMDQCLKSIFEYIFYNQTFYCYFRLIFFLNTFSFQWQTFTPITDVSLKRWKLNKFPNLHTSTLDKRTYDQHNGRLIYALAERKH